MHPNTAARIAARIAASETFPDLAERLAALFPGIDLVTDVEVRDDGSGPRIAAWHRPEPKPTPAELAAVVVPPPDLVITDLQARLWLNAAGFYESAVQSLIDAIPEQAARENARAVWDRSPKALALRSVWMPRSCAPLSSPPPHFDRRARVSAVTP
jgi:hypothetical protein